MFFRFVLKGAPNVSPAHRKQKVVPQVAGRALEHRKQRHQGPGDAGDHRAHRQLRLLLVRAQQDRDFLFEGPLLVLNHLKEFLLSLSIKPAAHPVPMASSSTTRTSTKTNTKTTTTRSNQTGTASSTGNRASGRRSSKKSTKTSATLGSSTSASRNCASTSATTACGPSRTCPTAATSSFPTRATWSTTSRLRRYTRASTDPGLLTREARPIPGPVVREKVRSFLIN